MEYRTIKKNDIIKNYKSNFIISDYIFDFLVEKGIKHVFVLTGGAIAFSIDAFSNRNNIKYFSLSSANSCKKTINNILNYTDCRILKVFIGLNQKIIPKLSFGSPIEDMSRKLKRKKFMKI